MPVRLAGHTCQSFFTGCPCILFELRMELLIQLNGLHQDVDLAEMHL